MAGFVVVGAGGIGRGAAAALAAQGHEVTMVTRSGTDPGLAGVRAVAADAADAQALVRAADGAQAIVNAMNPSRYYTWERDWPPVAAALLAAAETTGAGLVTASNLYLYGRVDAPMTERTPVAPNGTKGRVRARMWADALAAHEEGRVRATELRASDYFGPGSSAGTSLLNQYVVARAAAGSTVRLVTGVADAPHSWTYLPDIGRFAAALATDDRSWGRAWHVPTEPPRTMREVARDAAALAGHPEPRVVPLPRLVKLVARVAPVVRELDETAHQFERPFVLDSSAAQSTFGFRATPWDEALRATVAAVAG
ncbi:NAD-dependent epimerase/dehydratase family protein [Nocardioides sp.]|uniref:NAD-dependent epimerase/dehydratase family protein n=1 Tax=Nocardioides sp. TaxID=35761 RepID=UPI003528E7A0